MLDLLSSATALVALGFTFYLVSAQWSARRRQRQLARCRRAMIVCAHPDDECMFFGPAVVGLLREPACVVYLLCLSTGDHEGLGRVRKEELYRSCSVLGIKRENIILLRHSRLPDNPQRMWNDALLADIVLHHISSLDIDTVVSFDHQGVSYHRNHRSIFYGLVRMVSQELLPTDCSVYFVPTVNRVRKYSSFMDVPITYLANDIVFLASLDEWKRIQHAMAQHRSQLVWFRLLYMMFSRYVFINTLVQLRAPPPPTTTTTTTPSSEGSDGAADATDAGDESSTGEFLSPPESPVPPEDTEGHEPVT
ncbi:N-acetylglucosaminyl-phosphatidylinositol de-N-acetylase-like [Pollicipes pollicipes]|uniref:N-acetylglucosaminyl-phosphatidylinositol de-N-acetylase-like n=1 Tax=Pollicipes pollicipes TaxID=41117 RepID=UPI0018849F0F|nr:N-acetylglucosaminyl-phosphatidylinositol de-N-acetylase-like [Pollicipes pollicipes]